MNASDDKGLTGDAYEAYMGRWRRPLARMFVYWLRPKLSRDWRQVGCLAAALTSSSFDLCEPASVVACDPSVPFIELARRNLPNAGASFVVAGAEALPYRDDGFDAVVSGLVLNFVSTPEAAVAS